MREQPQQREWKTIDQKSSVNDGVHQSSALSPLLLAFVMDKVTKNVREGIVREFLYANGLVPVLLGES